MGYALFGMALMWILTIEICKCSQRHPQLANNRLFIGITAIQSIVVILISRVIYPIILRLANDLFSLLGESCHFRHSIPSVPAIMVCYVIHTYTNIIQYFVRRV